MGLKKQERNKADSLFISPEGYFAELVNEGFEQRKVDTYPQVKSYIVNLLQHYLDAKNLFEAPYDEAGNKRPQTLAELFLIANNSETTLRIELLKKLGDRSLYISGFFGDSLERKVVDVDYYVNMGGAAYANLSSVCRENTLAKVYQVFSERFIEFADVLTYISQRSLVQNNQSLLRLYERYLRTGSELAKEKLIEMGVLTLPLDQSRLTKQ